MHGVSAADVVPAGGKDRGGSSNLKLDNLLSSLAEYRKDTVSKGCMKEKLGTGRKRLDKTRYEIIGGKFFAMTQQKNRETFWVRPF